MSCLSLHLFMFRREERQKQIQKNMDSSLTSDTNISSYLKGIAEHRADIFEGVDQKKESEKK